MPLLPAARSILAFALVSASLGLGLESRVRAQTIPSTTPAAGSASAVSTAKTLLEQPASIYRERRAELMERIAAAEKLDPSNKDATAPEVLVVLVGELDEPEDARFRQNNWFAYLTGVDSPRASLVLRVPQREETLYLPARNKMMERWTGPKLGPGPEGVEATGCARVEPASRFNADLKKFVGGGKVDEAKKDEPATASAIVYVISPYVRDDASGPTARLTKTIRDLAPSAKIKGLSGILGEMRKRKSAPEIALLRRAIDITGDAQAAVMRGLAPGVKEYELEGALMGAFISGGAQRAGFPSIVGSGPNSTVLHHNSNRRTAEAGELVVVDIGAEYFYYTADITRTFPISGTFTPRQREIYQLVLDAQRHAESVFEVGETTPAELHQEVVDFLRKSPLRAKNAAGVEQTMDRFFIHGLGHYLGMDVHDVGNAGKPYMPGEVFTIEPGIYITTENLGVRIEDDYLVTEKGLEKLSKAIPVEIDAIEKAIAEARSGGRAE
ncbi:MAG: Xaa-Pro aminopeptidase [Isosphaeraceae bacterium]|nr:Xaa-Pro aminopeptidase [Isosphaeraceae bacterium]